MQRRRHRRPDRHQIHHHRRHPVLREGTAAAGKHPLPRDRHRPEDRAAVGQGTGQAVGGAAQAVAGRPLLPGAFRRRDRGDGDLGHGRTAPGHHRRPAQDRAQGRGQGRQARRRLPRGHHPRGGEPITSSKSRPAARASSPISSCASSPIPAWDWNS